MFCLKFIIFSLHCSLISLEYCSAIWDPYTQELTQKVGKIQRRAARLVHKIYDWQASVSGLIRDLGWDMLSTRRKIARLNILHKAIGDTLHYQSKTIFVRPKGKPAVRTVVLLLNTIQELMHISTHLYPEL